MTHQVHETHSHVHGDGCGHTRIQHGDHVDFLHDGHLHAAHAGHYDECSLKVSGDNPAECRQIDCGCTHGNCQHETVPHGDHADYLVDGRLHHQHDGHCDDHGMLRIM